MITIETKIKDDLIYNVSVHGHAMYDDYGKDIVCAAVSSIVMTSVNNILSLDQNGISYEESENKIVLRDIKTMEGQKIIQCMLHMLNELQKDYPKNIKIRNEDVKQ